MLTLTDYEQYENNVTAILNAGVNVDTGVPFDVTTVDKNLDITFEEHFAFQNCQATIGRLATELDEPPANKTKFDCDYETPGNQSIQFTNGSFHWSGIR